MTKISALTADTALTPDDIFPTVTDPAGTPANRKAQLGAALGLTGYAFLDANTSVSATSATVKGIPSWTATSLVWGVIDPGNTECEIRLLTISGSAISWTGGLTYAHAANDPVLLIPTAALHIKWFGAKGDGSTDDRTAIDRAIAQANTIGGADILFPPGTFIVSKNSTSGYRGCIVLDNVSNVRLIGSGMDTTTIKRQGTSWSGDTHVFDLRRVNNFEMRDLTVNGNRAGSTPPNDQNHNIYLRAKGGASNNVRFIRIHTTNSIGVGFYLSGDLDDNLYYTSNVRIESCRITDTGTSGIGHQRALLYVRELYNYFESVSDTEFDYEPTGSVLNAPENIHIIGNTIIHSTGALSIQLAGINSTRPLRKVKCIGNIILSGAVNILDAEDIEFADNYLLGANGNNPTLSITQHGRRILISENTVINNRTSADQAAIRIARAGGNSPEDVTIDNNILVNAVASAGGVGQYGIYVNNAQKIAITNNRLYGAGGTSGRGIYLLNNADYNPAYDFLISGNTLRNFGGRGIQLASPTPASFPFNTVTIVNNNFYDDQGTPSMTTGIEIGSTSGLLVTGQSLTIANNTYGTGITSAVVNTAGSAQAWSIGGSGGGTLGVSIYTGSGSPEGVVTSPIGSLYLRRDGGTNTTLYIKESGTGSSGWAAK